jgi:hypothetical protein
MEGYCEHGTEPSDSINCLEILKEVHNCRRLKKVQIHGFS